MLKRSIFTLLLLFPLLVLAEQFVEGKDYVLLTHQSEAKLSQSTPTVTEFFSYGCPWCYRVESSLTNWVQSKGKTIQFERVPVAFNKDWDLYAKAYYTAHFLGLDATLNPLLFKAIQDKKNTLNTQDAMLQFFINQGVEASTAKSALENSTTIDMKIKEDMRLLSQYQISGIPALIVNKQYKTDLQMAKNEQRLLQILDYLIAKK